MSGPPAAVAGPMPGGAGPEAVGVRSVGAGAGAPGAGTPGDGVPGEVGTGDGAPGDGTPGGRRAAGRSGVTAHASVSAELSGGRTRLRWSQAWPVILRPTGDARVHLVHGAGGPLGGDVLTLDVRVGAAAVLDLRSAGATLVQPGRDPAPARWDTTVTVAEGGALDWAPEPTVVTDGAAFATSLRVDLAAGARASVREVVVLGRHGTRGGRYRGRLDVRRDGVPLLAHTTLLDGADPALAGPGGTAGARCVGSLLVTAGAGEGAGEERGVRWAWSPLAAGPDAGLLLAVGEPAAVLDALSRA